MVVGVGVAGGRVKRTFFKISAEINFISDFSGETKSTIVLKFIKKQRNKNNIVKTINLRVLLAEAFFFLLDLLRPMLKTLSNLVAKVN